MVIVNFYFYTLLIGFLLLIDSYGLTGVTIFYYFLGY